MKVVFEGREIDCDDVPPLRMWWDWNARAWRRSDGSVVTHEETLLPVVGQDGMFLSRPTASYYDSRFEHPSAPEEEETPGELDDFDIDPVL